MPVLLVVIRSVPGVPFTVVDYWDSWGEARETCKRRGGDLAKVDSAEKRSQLLATLKLWRPVNGSVYQGQRFWIGATDIMDAGVWHWVSNGSKLDFTDWSKDEPNGLGKEHCAFLKMPAGQWYDGRCEGRNAFVCEISSPSSFSWGKAQALQGREADQLRSQLEACKQSRPADAVSLKPAEATAWFLAGLTAGVALVVCCLGGWGLVRSRLLSQGFHGLYATVGRSQQWSYSRGSRGASYSRASRGTAEDEVPLATVNDRADGLNGS